MNKLVTILALLAALHGVTFGTFTASGADSDGYVSHADLWLRRTLVTDQPLHDEFTWRWANWTLAPLGYRPGEVGGTMVPVYGPGLPLVMAMFKAIGGETAVFLMRDAEARYRVAAQFAASLPENALFLCNLHSGSLRYYANRLTLRFAWLEPDVYVDALRQIRESGRPLFVVLDEAEREVFRARYATVSDLSWLDEPPTLLAAKREYFYQLW